MSVFTDFFKKTIGFRYNIVFNTLPPSLGPAGSVRGGGDALSQGRKFEPHIRCREELNKYT